MVRLRISGSANRSAKVKRVSACSCACSVAPLFFLRARRLALLVGLLPGLRFFHAAAQPEGEQRRDDADEEHVAPGARPVLADEQPDEGGEEEADAEPALHQPGAAPARVVGPGFRGDGGAGRPFRADGDADQQAQQRERFPVPGEGREARRQRIGEDRVHHGAAAADIVGEDAAEHAADAPAEQRDADHRAGIGADGAELRRLEQLMQRRADHQDQREGLVAVEHPADVRGDHGLPLVRVQAAIPGFRRSH